MEMVSSMGNEKKFDKWSRYYYTLLHATTLTTNARVVMEVYQLVDLIIATLMSMLSPESSHSIAPLA